jgi:hypothetical protein
MTELGGRADQPYLHQVRVVLSRFARHADRQVFARRKAGPPRVGGPPIAASTDDQADPLA